MRESEYMTDFFPGLAEFTNEKKEERELNYSKRMLKKIIKQIDPTALPRLLLEAGEDFDLDWFNDTQHPPVLLEAKMCTGITLASLLVKSFLKGKVAALYFDAYASYGANGVGAQLGIIFPIDSSPWVITDATLEVRASNYVQRHGNSAEVPSLAIMRLDDFIDAWKRQGFVF